MAKVDRRILKTQESLKKAVIELMTEKNFDDITIQDIADRANVNRGTIYLHYQDKFDLLDKLIETHINELERWVNGHVRWIGTRLLYLILNISRKIICFFRPC